MQTTLVLGLGDRARGDDGIGPLAIERLSRDYDLDPRVMVMDSATIGMRLLPVLTAVKRVLVIAALRLEAPIGTLHRLQWIGAHDALEPRLPAFRPGGIELLRTLHFWIDPVPEVVVLGVEVPPATGGRPSDSARNALDTLVDAAVGELHRWGHRLEPHAQSLQQPALVE